LKRYEEAVAAFKKLTEISEEFSNDFKEAENLYNEDIRKQKNKFRKMIFS
jgi:hypothetical protein